MLRPQIQVEINMEEGNLNSLLVSKQLTLPIKQILSLLRDEIEGFEESKRDTGSKNSSL